MSDPLRAAVDARITEILSRREEIVEAFIAKYGFEPDEAVLVERRTATGSRFWVERRGPSLKVVSQDSPIDLSGVSDRGFRTHR